MVRIRNKHILEGGEAIYNVHSRDACDGGPCPIHNMTDHHMRRFPQHYRADRRIMERICLHGVGHPDPDDPTEDRVHGCDGCCELRVFDPKEE